MAGLALTPMNGAQHLIWHGPRSPVRSAATILLSGVIIVPLRRKDDHLDTLDSLITDSEDPVAVRWRRTLHLCALGVAAVAGFLGCVVIHQATSGEHVALGLPTVGGGQEQMLWAFVPAAAGAAIAALFNAGQPLLGGWLDAVPAPSWVQAMLATMAVALLAAFLPQARFSGHEQMPEIAAFIHDGAWVTLAALACASTSPRCCCAPSAPAPAP